MPTSPLRADQVELTRTRILDGAAAVCERGDELTYRAVSEASGVIERTIYRHFPTRDHLSEALWQRLGDQLALPPSAADFDALLDQIELVFCRFDEHETTVRAMIHDPIARRARVAHRDDRRDEFRTALRTALSGRTAREQRRLLAVVQLLFSASAWESLRDYWDLTGRDAADAVRWAISTLVDSAPTAAPPPRRKPA